MPGFLLVTLLFVPLIHALESGVPDNTTRCVWDLVQWCDKMQYPQEGSGIAIVSLSYHDESGYNRVYCSSDSEGTSCTRNGSPWFACRPDHTLTYKGQVLTTNSSSNIDEDICATAEAVFSTLHLPDFSYDNATMTRIQKDMGDFFQEMTAMQQQIQELQRRLTNDFWSGFNTFFSEGSDAVEPNPASQGEAKDSNQIEREFKN